MNILMMSNTYLPIVGGLEKSIRTFTEQYRRWGHRVIIVAPRFDQMPPNETDVIRMPAWKNVKGTDFSLRLEVPGFLTEALKGFRPDIIHAHHPFLMGDTALRMAYRYDVPIVFTHHTLFEQNTHYFVRDSEWFKNFIVRLATGYANLVDRVFAPSASVGTLLKERGVVTPVDVVPTGINPEFFGSTERGEARAAFGFSGQSYVIGYTGRLAPEKNLEFLTRSVIKLLKGDPQSRFLVVGDGPSRETISSLLSAEDLLSRTTFAGVLTGERLVRAYSAMDVFAFASKSETQGLSILEAMACGVPVVALDAMAVRDVVLNGENGLLCPEEREPSFAELLAKLKDPGLRMTCSHQARRTASEYTVESCAKVALKGYTDTLEKHKDRDAHAAGYSHRNEWAAELKADWDLALNMTRATKGAARHVPEARCVA